MSKAIHSQDVYIRLSVPSLSIENMVIGTAQSFRSEIETSNEPYWSIGGPLNSQLGNFFYGNGSYSTSILATDFFRHRSLIRGTIRYAVLTSSSFLNMVGMALLLSSAEFQKIMEDHKEPFLPPNDGELSFDVRYLGRMLEYRNITATKSVLDSAQGQFTFETIDFWARNVVDKSIK